MISQLDASQLDNWVFHHVEDFLAQAKENPSLEKKLREDKVVLFLHLLGIDTVGHSKRPYSDFYKKNIINVDQGVQKIYKLVEDFFGDDATAYVFTADHGMSDKGNHGDGEQANTETPLIVWGAGVRAPHQAETIPAELKQKFPRGEVILHIFALTKASGLDDPISEKLETKSLEKSGCKPS